MEVTPSCRERVAKELSFPLVEDSAVSAETLVVIGGGSKMDSWKFRKRKEGFRLICVPSLFGSGAEVSPVVVLNTADGKLIEMDDAYKPDARVYWQELLATVPEDRARDACGDVWSHALEAFMSPLADDRLLDQIATLITEMSATPLGSDSAWFDFSARACDAQAQCSVGLIHGIAHSLELLLNDSTRLGHAALCSVLLWPVLRFNREHSEKWSKQVTRFDVAEATVERILRNLFDSERFEEVRSHLQANWKTILRDPCTRTNGVLVRPRHLEYFLETSFA